MESIVLYTEEIDDLDEAVGELFAGLGDFKFKKNSLGIIFAEGDTDYPALHALLSERLHCPIIGCTALAMLNGVLGYRGTGISLLLLTADDCFFSAGMTDDLTMDNYREEIASVYEDLAARLPSEPKLVISFGGMVSDDNDVSGDKVIRRIDEIAKTKIPIFGSLSSDGFDYTKYRGFVDGAETRHGQVIALVSGNVNPKFVTINSIDSRANFSYEVTEAHGNKVVRLGTRSFVETLEHEDMAIDKTDVLADYLLSPFVLTRTLPSGDSIEVARNLATLNHETGVGSFLGEVPEGAILGVGLISRVSVENSVNNAFEKILADISTETEKYHTLFCVSCCARFLAMASDTAAETKAYLGKLPEGVSLIGMYGYGEYSPVYGDKTKEIYNSFHNFTFTIMAI